MFLDLSKRLLTTAKFTMKQEKDGFLDTKLTQREDGTLNYLQKETHRKVLALQLPPSSKCKEGSRQESL